MKLGLTLLLRSHHCQLASLRNPFVADVGFSSRCFTITNEPDCSLEESTGVVRPLDSVLFWDKGYVRKLPTCMPVVDNVTSPFGRKRT